MFLPIVPLLPIWLAVGYLSSGSEAHLCRLQTGSSLLVDTGVTTMIGTTMIGTATDVSSALSTSLSLSDAVTGSDGASTESLVRTGTTSDETTTIPTLVGEVTTAIDTAGIPSDTAEVATSTGGSNPPGDELATTTIPTEAITATTIIVPSPDSATSVTIATTAADVATDTTAPIAGTTDTTTPIDTSATTASISTQAAVATPEVGNSGFDEDANDYSPWVASSASEAWLASFAMHDGAFSLFIAPVSPAATLQQDLTSSIISPDVDYSVSFWFLNTVSPVGLGCDSVDLYCGWGASGKVGSQPLTLDGDDLDWKLISTTCRYSQAQIAAGNLGIYIELVPGPPGAVGSGCFVDTVKVDVLN